MQKTRIRIISLILMVVSSDCFGKSAAVVNVVFHLCFGEYHTLAERGETAVIFVDGHLVLCVCRQHCSRNIDCDSSDFRADTGGVC